MNEKYFDIVDYLKKTRFEDSYLLEALRYTLREAIYHHGDRFTSPRGEASRVKTVFRYIAEFIYANLFSKPHKKTKKILSGASHNYDYELENLGFAISRVPWSLKRRIATLRGKRLFYLTKKIDYQLKYNSFNALISVKFLNLLRDYKRELKSIIEKEGFDALIVPEDVTFFSVLSISTFKEIGKPTFFFPHGGIPEFYDAYMNNQTDYMTQWGQAQVEAFVERGFDLKKIFITGHPFYKTPPTDFRFGLDDVLVIAKSTFGACPLRKNHLQDLGNSILYLRHIQNTLKKLGVNKVRFRPHPSEDSRWYLKFIDRDFFIPDTQALPQSLNQASLVIGPISTVFADAMAHGVNYTVYEPVSDGITINGNVVSPPLDGKDSRIPVARNEAQLANIIQNKQKIDATVYPEFMGSSFDLSFIKDLV